jgi:hypothetical protein
MHGIQVVEACYSDKNTKLEGPVLDHRETYQACTQNSVDLGFRTQGVVA